MRKAAASLMILTFLVGCGAMGTAPSVDEKRMLYEVKEKWVKVREVVIVRYATGKISEAEYQKFKNTDADFTESYVQARYLIESGQGQTPSMKNLINHLEELILIEQAKGGPK